MFDSLSGADLLPLIVLFPLAGAIANGFFGKNADRKLVGFTAVASVAGAFLVALISFIKLYSLKGENEGAMLTADLWEWFSVALPASMGTREVPVNIRFVFDSLSGLMTLVVTGIGTLIHIYSLGYMSEEKSYARFFTYLNLFTASMLVLVLGSSFPVLFVGWEGVGLCSYLLIGFWYENKDYANAGRKAFIVNRIGDFGVLIGMFILLLYAGSFEFTEINSRSALLGGEFTLLGSGVGLSVATVACLFLFLGCTGKSAQIPLFVWLPDAMAGPTPVSALIHAATMVTAGVYLCCRLSPVFLESPVALSVIAVVGTCTALLAATVAVVQKEMKRILAYSTVSQLGFMFAAVGVGAFAAGFFHVFTHAFFKACLFLGAGSVMHAVHAHGDANIFKLGGVKKYMPVTHWTFLISCVAIAGFPLTSGFFSKDEILLGATTVAMNDTAIPQWVGWFVAIGLFLAATMTAFYMMRLYYLTFTGEFRGIKHGDDAHADHGAHDDDHDDHHDHDYPEPHASPISMTFPLAVLATGAALAGLLGLPHAFHAPNWWGPWMSASIAHLPGFGPTDEVTNMTPVWVALGFGLTAVTVGMLSAHLAYYNKAGDTTTTKIPAPIYNLFMDKWRVDELYDRIIVRPIRGISVFLGRVDKTFVDFIFTGAAAFFVKVASFFSTRIQVGRVHAYGAVMAVGLVGMLWWVAYPHAGADVEVNGADVEFVAGAGLGYEYRWDFDNDGDYDSPAQGAHITIDIRDDASDSEITQLVMIAHRIMGPRAPRDRSILGSLSEPREALVYHLSASPATAAALVDAFENAGDVIESVESSAISEAHFSRSGVVSHSYTHDDIEGFQLVLNRPRDMPLTIELGERAVELDAAPNWMNEEPAEGNDSEAAEAIRASLGVPPVAWVEEDGVHIRPNGGRVAFGPEFMREEFVVRAGDTLQIGTATVLVEGLAYATVEVRNVFGNIDRERVQVVVQTPGTAVAMLEEANQ